MAAPVATQLQCKSVLSADTLTLFFDFDEILQSSDHYSCLLSIKELNYLYDLLLCPEPFRPLRSSGTGLLW